MIDIAGRNIANTLAELVAPQRSALLLWDMEYGIAPNAFNDRDILPRLQGLAASARFYRSILSALSRRAEAIDFREF